MSEFSRKQLEKYGWTDGKGLGRQEDGISTPIKAKLKLNSHGVGYDCGDQFKFNWWEHVFNKASKNLEINNKEDDVTFISKRKNRVQIQSNRPTKFSKSDLHLGSFVKSQILTTDGIKDCVNQKTKCDTDSSDSDELDENEGLTHRLTEEKIFIKSGGLTAHKAARFGLKMSGKLSRVEQQDKEFKLLNSHLEEKTTTTCLEKINESNDEPVKRNRKRKKRNAVS